jgi:endosialidase-like protein
MEISRIRFAAAAKIAAAVVLAVTAVSNAQNTVFVALPPCRIANTTVAGGPIASGGTRGFNVVGASFDYSAQGGSASGCGIPGFAAFGVPAVQAIAVNVVAVNPTGQGNLRAFPGNLGLPNASTLNYQNFSDISHPYNIANGVIVPVNQAAQNASNDLKVFVSTTTDVVMDVTGYFTKLPIRAGLAATSPDLLGGSDSNFLGPNNVQGATIGGGGDAGGPNSVTSNFATVAGGRNNNAGGNNANTEGLWSTVGGGEGNGAAANHATVGGGTGNLANGDNATIGGGSNNDALGNFSTVPGGSANSAAGNNSFAAGSQATVAQAHNGAMLFSDDSGFAFNSAAAREFAVRSIGGARFVSAINGSGTPTAGVTLAPGGGSWSSLSDRDAKQGITAVDGAEVLARLAKVPVSTWSYRSQPNSIRHIGPMAQDFHTAFSVGEDDKHIATVDADGVALAAIQALYKLIQEKDAEIQELRSRVNGLQSIADRVKRLERQLPLRTASLDESRP